MIVVADPESILVVTQADHARLAAEMVRLFVDPEVALHPRRRELLDAIACHDDGWWEADAAPTLDPATGGPQDFRALSPAAREEIWTRGVERHAARSPYVAAMVAGHLVRLHESRRTAETAELGERLAARREELIEEGGLDRDALARDDRWLRVGDDLSLAAASGEPGFLASTGYRARLTRADGAVELALDPFPLAGSTRLELPARTIARRRHRDGVELGLALATARWQALVVRLAPL
ncbi:MAG: DUF3891 family protein [Acidobacteria bacterium]|nr:DUF3891 family protein [Acidobacteriota bacterium]